MTGETEVLMVAIVLTSLIAFATDLRDRKIYNWLTFSAMAFGILANAISFGVPGGTNALLAVGLGALLYGWMYALKVMGAGDVKLLMAYGALGGTAYVLDVAIFGILIGGVFALALLIAQRKFGSFWTRMQVTLLAAQHRRLGIERPGLDHRLKMPFGISLAIAAVWVRFSNPLEAWGMRLWH